MSKLIGLLISLIGVLMPWRLRIFFSELLGWFTQFIYFTYYGILNYLLKELKKTTSENTERNDVNHVEK